MFLAEQISVIQNYQEPESWQRSLRISIFYQPNLNKHGFDHRKPRILEQ